MSRSRTLLSLSALFVFAGGLLLGARPAQPPPAYAADCSPDETGTLIIRILYLETDDPVDFGGTNVLIDPDPTDFDLDKLVTDSDIDDAGALQDQDNASGIIRIEGACSTEGGEAYAAILYAVPAGLEEVCEPADASDATQLDADETATLVLTVECTDVTPTATPGATSTPNPTAAAQAATVLVNAAAPAVSCGGSTVVAVLVTDAAGKPVKAGTPVGLTANLGGFSPPSGLVTDANGFASATYVAAAAGGGTATIVGTSGTASDATQVTVSCISDVLSSGTQSGAAAGSIIRPPNTGDGGLVGGG